MAYSFVFLVSLFVFRIQFRFSEIYIWTRMQGVDIYPLLYVLYALNCTV